MRIDSLRLVNFRCFEDRTFTFDPRFTLLIGKNATGKSAILDAMAVALGAALISAPDTASVRIERRDVRRRNRPTEIARDYIEHYPVQVEAIGSIGDKRLSWTRELTRPNSSTTYKKTKKLRKAMENLMELDVKDEPVVFPFIGYYGTGRLWGERRLRSELPLDPAGRATRYAGYRDCLDPRSNEKHMRDWIARLALIQAQRRIQLATLSAVYEAIAACVEGARAAEFDLKENDIVVEFEDGARFPLGFLSDGQRSMVALAADIAMRCAQLNPHLNDSAPLETPGVVLIDELDLHLHPRWQRHVVEDLMEAFPKLQFMATTHSPFFVQSMRRGGVINLGRGDSDPEKIREKSIEDIAEDIMGVEQPQHSRRYMKMLKAAERYYTAIDDAAAACDPAEIEKLRNCLDELEEPFADDPAYVAFLRAQRAAKGRE